MSGAEGGAVAARSLEYAHPGGEPLYWGLTATAWVKAAIVAALMAALFRFNLYRLWLKTAPGIGEPNWQHAIFVPLAGLYYLFVNREELLRAKVRPLRVGDFTRRRLVGGLVLLVSGVLLAVVGPLLLHGFAGGIAQSAGVAAAVLGFLGLLLNWGLGTVVLGILLFGYGIWPGQNDFVKDFGMVVTLFGVVLMMCGWDVMKVAWFPIVFLVCAIPWPGLVYSWVALPLQRLAAQVAVGVLHFAGVIADGSGTKIFFIGYGGQRRALNVEEACAGLRSLMTFVSVAAAVAFLSARPLWQKVLITGSAVPIAIFCNVMRVAGQGLLDYHLGPTWSQGFAHGFVGLVMLVPAFFLILLVGWILDHLFVEEVEDKYELGARRVVVAKAAVAAPVVVKREAVVTKVEAKAQVAPAQSQVVTAKPQAAAVAPPPVKRLTPPKSGGQARAAARGYDAKEGRA